MSPYWTEDGSSGSASRGTEMLDERGWGIKKRGGVSPCALRFRGEPKCICAWGLGMIFSQKAPLLGAEAGGRLERFSCNLPEKIACWLWLF